MDLLGDVSFGLYHRLFWTRAIDGRRLLFFAFFTGHMKNPFRWVQHEGMGRTDFETPILRSSSMFPLFQLLFLFGGGFISLNEFFDFSDFLVWTILMANTMIGYFFYGPSTQESLGNQQKRAPMILFGRNREARGPRGAPGHLRDSFFSPFLEIHPEFHASRMWKPGFPFSHKFGRAEEGTLIGYFDGLGSERAPVVLLVPGFLQGCFRCSPSWLFR